LPSLALQFNKITSSELEAVKSGASSSAALIGKSFVSLLPIFAAIAAAIGVIAFEFNELQKTVTANERAIQSYRDAASSVREAHDELVSTIEQLDQSQSTYDTAVDKLKKCTEGTQE
jgi:hypothetical protein